MKLLTLVLLTLTACSRGQGPQTVSLSLQQADLAAIPGSTREVYANLQGKDLTVNWKVTGGCTLASATTRGVAQRVTAPAQGAKCRLRGAPPTNEAPSFESAVSCRVTATSAANPVATASIAIPVCDPKVELTTFPMTTVLYRNQYAVIQSDLRGSVQTGIRWEITQNPGGAGALTGGNQNRHVVFSARAAGTYVLTATSVADPAKKAETVIYVTAHDLPAPNKDHTEAVDCTAVGSGKVYDVGPARALKNINDVPWPQLGPGDTVRIHNDDTTGDNPTTYHQHFAILGTGTAKEPIRVCGVPDAKGNKPIVDGADATTRPDEDWGRGALEQSSLVVVFDSKHRWDITGPANKNILIEGLHIRNGTDSVKFLKTSNSTLTPYNTHTSCVTIMNGRGIMVRGNELENCNQAIFSDAQTLGGTVYDFTVEGNYLHNWGWIKGYMHGMYLQAIGVQVQFNYFGPSFPGIPDDAFKSRSVMNFVRWNYVDQAEPKNARAFDLVEPQAFNCYVIPYDFAQRYHGGHSVCQTTRGGADADSMSADEVASNFEAFHADYIYGNIINDAGSRSGFVHYGYDVEVPLSPAADRRGGTLFYWNNTHLYRLAGGVKTIFDPWIPDSGHSYEFPVIESINNVFATSAKASYQWVRPYWAHVNIDSNWMTEPAMLPNRKSNDAYSAAGITESTACTPEGICKPSNGQMTWARNGKPVAPSSAVFTGPSPFALSNFAPAASLHGLGAELPSGIRNQPSNMQYLPETNRILPRKDMTVLGALE